MARKIQPRSKTPKPRPGQSSEEYWRERETRQRAANIHDEARYAARINSIFETVQDSIQQEIESFYQRYAGKEGIDISEARRRVSKIDMEKYERLAAQYVKAAHEGGREAAFSDEANEQMRLYNATMRINRLEMLKARCGIRAMEGYRLTDQLINEALKERAYSEYERLAGILGNTVQFNENMVRSIVDASYQNATWSQRLWNNQALLSAQIGAQIAQGILTGKGSDVLARNIQKLTGQSAYNCQRLMRTELRRVQTAAAEQSMLDNGVTAYKFLVANGVNPCDECVALDGQVFKIRDMEIGKNAPPKHPSCHCCTCPAIDEEKWQRWLDGPAQAGVPWEEFDAKNPSNPPPGGRTLTEEEKLNRTIFNNRKRDKEQYHRYRKVLGDMIPDSLESFQQMKYNNTGRWNAVKHNYRIVNSYEINAGSMKPEKILQLDDIAFSGKKGLFTGEAKRSANIAVMEMDGHLYYANSKATEKSDPAYYNFKGNKEDLILMKTDGERQFLTKVINHDRKVDSEAKLFEHAADIAKDGERHTINLLSERCMCDSCLGVLSQFQKKYKNVKVNATSGRRDRSVKNKNNPWKHRK